MRKYTGKNPDHIHSWGKAGEMLFAQTKGGAHYFLPSSTPTDDLIGRNVFEFKFHRAQKMLLVQHSPGILNMVKGRFYISVNFDRIIDREQWPFFTYVVDYEYQHGNEAAAQARSYITQQLAQQNTLTRFQEHRITA